jgi:hypothetical protein
MNWRTRIAAFMALVLWSLAAMHCQLEDVPGLNFLKSCCLADSVSSSPNDCKNDDCCAAENSDYRPEERTASAPRPLLVTALLSALIESPVLEPQVCFPTVSPSPPEHAKVWQFSQRAAQPPRAPSAVA